MSVKNYRFVSPGVFVNEIDNSQLPASPAGIGPVIFGRAQKGPALRPVSVNSFEEFVNIFGAPAPGNSGDDVWRQGNYSAPTYASYAAQAYLAAGVGPVNVVRLMGAQDPAASTTGKAGWDTTNTVDSAPGSNGGAYGLWMIQSGAYDAAEGAGQTPTGSLAAILRFF